MAALFPETRISAALTAIPRDCVRGLADHVIEKSPFLSESIRKGREEVALDKAAGQNVYVVSWTDSVSTASFCFFGHSEQEVLDRLAVAEVMVG